MNTTNRHIHLRCLLPSKPPPWRHRRRLHHTQHLRLILIHLLLFSLAKYANTTPLKTTPIKTTPIKTTPTSPQRSLPILCHISANHNKINPTSLYHHQPPIHPNPTHSPSTNRPFYLPQPPHPTAPIFLIVNQSPTHAASINSYVNTHKKFCHSTTYNPYDPIFHAPNKTNFQDSQPHKRHHSTKYHIKTPLRHLRKNSLQRTPLRYLTKNSLARTPQLTPLIISEYSYFIVQPHMRTWEKPDLATHPHTTKPSKHKIRNIYNWTNNNTNYLERTFLHIPKTMSDQPPNLAELFTNLLNTADANTRAAIFLALQTQPPINNLHAHSYVDDIAASIHDINSTTIVLPSSYYTTSPKANTTTTATTIITKTNTPPHETTTITTPTTFPHDTTTTALATISPHDITTATTTATSHNPND